MSVRRQSKNFPQTLPFSARIRDALIMLVFSWR
jgi:hypothetical protein